MVSLGRTAILFFPNFSSNFSNKFIKEILTKSGINFKGSSDTEVLLNYYIYLNGDVETLIKKCNGMFSFVIMDRTKKKIYFKK